jgi:hypothetical protein
MPWNASELKTYFHNTNRKYGTNKTHNALKCNGCIAHIFQLLADEDAREVVSGTRERTTTEVELHSKGIGLTTF